MHMEIGYYYKKKSLGWEPSIQLRPTIIKPITEMMRVKKAEEIP